MEIKQELRPYVPLAQMLVQTLGPNCEVVLHDLDTPAHSVVYVENPSVTGRKVGESFDQLVKPVSYTHLAFFSGLWYIVFTIKEV